MKSKGYVRRDGTVIEDTHTYDCLSYKNRFEITQIYKFMYGVSLTHHKAARKTRPTVLTANC